MDINRRRMLVGLGSATAAGAAGIALTADNATAMSSDFSAANPGVVKSDDGDVSEVYVAPRVFTRWKNFDEPPLKIRYVLEAGIEGRGYTPVYRETPWLFTDASDPEGTATHGTTDRYPKRGRTHLLTANSDFYEINANGDVVDPSDGSRTVPPKIVLYRDGLSTYYDAASDYPDEAHYTGASLGGDAGSYANGNYGVIGDTSALDAPTDGGSNATKIYLRLTTALLNADSETVMQAEYPAYSGEAGYTYERLRDVAPNNPAVSVSTTSFTVTAENERAASSTSASANPGVN
ncbi:hypothetical protein [Halomarina pelagica]|uniref:hypothetical protein n=1 Tax=Halomarina pelagica TaxID=2961599 RepID=UPI0020C33574|nr:hypothetical protein [Halomarina sp. BND7]